MKRIQDCQSSDFRNMTRQELLDAIAGSEGRTIAREAIGSIMPTLGDITNAEFAAAMGADIILLPTPGMVPGITMEYVRDLVNYAHSLGCLACTAIGTSQEGADIATIRQIALMCKMAGTDIHHLGDAGYGGMAGSINR